MLATNQEETSVELVRIPVTGRIPAMQHDPSKEPEMIHCTIPAAVLASALAGTAPDANSPVGPGRIPQLEYEKYTLPNGLDVILHEDHSTPIVCVNIWYHVGSKNERRGRTGFAHLFEHMMFQGSEHHDSEYFGPLQEAGGRLNGSTSDDRTNYWEVVPSNYLELALWLESDRMGFLLPAMSQEKLDNQRDVVKNERRQSYENRPYGLAPETIAAAMYPADHPYSWPTIGYMDDLTAASREDIADFFRRYYHPGNASLCIAGDFEPATARKLVEKYFGSLPTGPKVEKMKPQTPKLSGEKRLQMTDRVGLPRLYLNWHSVEADAPDDAELDLLAMILAGGKSSRLYRVLVQEKQLAQDVSAFQRSGEIAGSFSITATAKPGVKLADIESLIAAEIKRIQSEPPAADELERAVNRYEVQFVNSLDSVGGFGGVADRLNRYNVMNDDPGYMQQDFERYVRVDLAGVQRVARKYLNDDRVVLEVIPGRERTVSPDPIAENATAAKDSGLGKSESRSAISNQQSAISHSFDRSSMPKPAVTPRFALPPIHRSKLASGLELMVVEQHELPTVNVSLLVRAGSAANPPDKLGLAGLVAAMLDEGTERRTANEIADELAGLGSSLSIRADWDTTRIGLFTLKRHLARSLDIFTDVLLHPTFPDEELNRQRSQALTNLVRLRDQPGALASLAIDATLYGEAHPYGRPESGNESTLKSITRDDIAAFYHTQFRPNQASLIVVGDVTVAEIARHLESALAEWKPSDVEPARVPAPPERPATAITLVDKPGAAQSVISIGQLGVLRTSPDYFQVLVMNTIFGGQFSSRLNMNLREEKGYTYGARSSFEWRQQPGPFVASASVQTAVTAPALAEFLKEFADLTGGRPVAEKELEFAKASITRGFPANFETSRDIAGRIEDLVEYGLPNDYYNTVVPKVSAVTGDEVMRAAKKYIEPEYLSIVLVGDRSQIEESVGKVTDGIPLHLRKFDDQFRLVPLE
jgi:zinc protease